MKEVNGMVIDTEMQLRAVTDEQIIELYWKRDEKAIKATAVKYGEMLFRIAYNILHDEPDAEECTSDAYLSVWNRIPPVRPTYFRAFIAKIMRDITINRYHQRTSKKRIPSELTVSLDELCDVFSHDRLPQDEYAIKELGKAISDYVRGLSLRRRYIFIGRFYFCNTLEHIASMLDVSVATVWREIKEIRQGLKIYLEGKEMYV